MKKFLPLFVFHLWVYMVAAQVNQVYFTMQPELCADTSVRITNRSNYGEKFYWASCNEPQDFTLKYANSISNVGMVSPVRMSLAHDSSGYYGFVSNHFGSSLQRLSFGNSFSNTPTGVSMGNFGGLITDRPEGISVKYDNGKWYGFVVAGLLPNAKLLRLDFGTSLANTPTLVNLGNFNSLINFSHGLDIFKYGDNWLGFVVNAFGNNLVRIEFGNSLANVPVLTDLGNVARFSYPTGIKLLERKGVWYGFVTSGSNSSFCVLNFGNSLLNAPTGTNLGNLGVLRSPFDVKVFSNCDTVLAFVSDNSANSIFRVNLDPSNMSVRGNAIPVLTAPFSTSEGMSETFRSNDTLFWFVCNVGTNSLTKVYYSNCNSLVGPYHNYNPPRIPVKPGVTTLSLTVDEGESTQQTLCQPIIHGGTGVKAGIINALRDTLCLTDTAQLSLSGNTIDAIRWQYSATGIDFTDIDGAYDTWYAPVITQPAYYRVVASTEGCADTTAPVQIAVAPPMSINLVTGDTLICPGKTASICAMGNYSALVWNTGDTASCIYASNAGGYWVRAISVAGCPDTTAPVQLSIAPPLAVSLVTDDSLICPGEVANICALGSYNSLVWSTGDTTNCLHTSKAGSYWANVVSAAGCPDTVAPVQLAIAPSLDVRLATDDSLICSGDSAYICASGNYSSLVWNTGDTTTCIYTKRAGGYWVNVTNEKGCTGVSAHQQLRVRPIPSVSVIIKGDTLTSFNASAYQWYMNGQPITGATSPVYIVRQPGEYSVEITDNNGCTAHSSGFPMLVTGLNTVGSKDALISVYPNPASGMVNIRHTGTDQIFQMTTYNVLGEKLTRGILDFSTAGTISVDVSELASGTYLLQLQSATQQYLQRLIIR